MSKAQIWVVAAIVGVVVIIASLRYFSGSGPEEESAIAGRLAQRAAQTEKGTWSNRSRSEDIVTGDDVRVQRQVEVKPGSVPGQRPQPGSEGGPQAPDGGATQPEGGTAQPQAQVGNGAVKGALGGPGDSPVDAVDVGGEPIRAPSGPDIEPGSLAANAPGAIGMGAGQVGVPGSAGTAKDPETPPAHPTPAEWIAPDDLRVGAVYSSEDKTFSLDAPVEIDNIGTIPGPGVTMMIDLEPVWDAENQDDVSLLRLGDNLELSKNVTFIRLEYIDANGAPQSIGSDMRKWAERGIEPPYRIAAIANGNKLWLIVNGVQVSHTVVAGGPYQAPENPGLQIGCVGYPASRPCAGGNGSNVVIVPSIPPAEAIARTIPPDRAAE